MKHWETAFMGPGYYSISQGSSASRRQFAVPLTQAARHIAMINEPQAELYPDAKSGDLTPLPAIPILDVGDLVKLDEQANNIQGQRDDPAAFLERDLVLT